MVTILTASSCPPCGSPRTTRKAPRTELAGHGPSYPLGFQLPHNEWFGAEVQIRLYRGDGHGAWNFLSTQYQPSLARSHLLRSQRLRIFFYRAAGPLRAGRGHRAPRPRSAPASRRARRAAAASARGWPGRGRWPARSSPGSPPPGATGREAATSSPTRRLASRPST